VATGFVVLFLTLIVFFWVRWGCESARIKLLPEQGHKLDIDVAGLIMPRTKEEPNGIPCLVHAAMVPEEVPVEGLGVLRYLNAHLPDAPDSPVYAWTVSGDHPRLYYDRSLGMIVYHFRLPVLQPDGTYLMRPIPDGTEVVEEEGVAYAGPKGMADKPDSKLGRFTDPLVRTTARDIAHQIVYDRGLRQFFALDWYEKKVRQGPPLPANAAPPVDFGWAREQAKCLNLYIETPEPLLTYGVNPDRTLVLDAAGIIQMLDLDTVEYTGFAGGLPAPATLFPSDRRAKPDDLFAFQVLPVFVNMGKQYIGCAVAVLSRDATAARLEVFDANGASVATANTFADAPWPEKGSARRRGSISTATAVYLELPGAAVLTAVKFILESIHPPALLLASYFTASSVEATAGHRSLFLLPNSFVAMKSRDARYGPIDRFWTAMPFLLPSVLFGVLFGAAVARDAHRAGLPACAKRLWFVATVLLGLPAYITYWITRPKTARVTCQNCGRWRWVNRETCHHCGSPWLVPELVPPAWRVIGQPEEQPCNDPSPRPEQTTSREPEV
jgi:hypothetical protein